MQGCGHVLADLCGLRLPARGLILGLLVSLLVSLLVCLHVSLLVGLADDARENVASVSTRGNRTDLDGGPGDDTRLLTLAC